MGVTMTRWIVAALLSLASLLATGAAEASSVTIIFSGTVTQFSDPGHLTSYGIGSTISGTITIDPLANGPSVNKSTKTQFIGAAALDSDPFSHAGTAVIETLSQTSTQDGHFGIQFAAPTETENLTDFIPSFLSLDITASNATNTPLKSLAALPTDLAGIIAYLGGILSHATGTLAGGPHYDNLSTFTFDIDSLSISATITPSPAPIPAALPLFGTALVALGAAGWRRRSRQAA